MRFAVVAIVFGCLAWAVAPASAAAGRPQALALLAEGDALAAAGDRDGALVRYRAAIAEDPDLVAAYDHAVPLWFDTQRWTEAAHYLERATTRHPDWAYGWYSLGFVYRKTGQLDAAVAAYEECAAMRPGDADPWYGLAVSRELSGDITNAVRAWRRYLVLEVDPEKGAYRTEARRAIDRLLGPPRDWRDAFVRALVDGGPAAWRRVATTMK